MQFLYVITSYSIHYTKLYDELALDACYQLCCQQGMAAELMFREISKEKFLKAKDEPNRVFLSDFDDSKWHDLKVPGHWGMINEFSNYTGKAWYRKNIELPKGWTKVV